MTKDEKPAALSTIAEWQAWADTLPEGPYQPTTDEVRHDWATFQNTTGEGHLAHDPSESYPEFDSWLESVIRAAQAEALREEALRWENTTDGRPYNAYGVARELEMQAYVVEANQ